MQDLHGWRVEEEEVCLLTAPGLEGREGVRLKREQEKQRLGLAACESRSLGCGPRIASLYQW